MKYRKKPVVVEAWPVAEIVRGVEKDWASLPQVVRDTYETGGFVFAHDHVLICTLEGTMRADRGDWLIRGLHGEFYPCKPDVFANTYEPVEAGKQMTITTRPEWVGPLVHRAFSLVLDNWRTRQIYDLIQTMQAREWSQIVDYIVRGMTMTIASGEDAPHD